MNKFNKYSRMFFAEDGDEGGSPSVADVLGDVEEQVEGGEKEGSDEGDGKDKPIVEKSGTTATLDVEKMAKLFGEQIAKSMPKASEKVAEAPAKQLSPEEAKKLLNFPDITDDWLKKFGDMTTQKAALEEFRDNMAKFMYTLTHMRAQELNQTWEDKWQKEFTPFQQQQQAEATRKAEEQFNTSYPELSNEALSPLKGAVAEQLLKAGKLTGSMSENLTAIAKGVEAVIQATQPTFKLTSKGTIPKSGSSKKPNANEIPVTTHGNGGGGGSTPSGEGGKNKSRLVSILGEVGN